LSPGKEQGPDISRASTFVCAKGRPIKKSKYNRPGLDKKHDKGQHKKNKTKLPLACFLFQPHKQKCAAHHIDLKPGFAGKGGRDRVSAERWAFQGRDFNITHHGFKGHHLYFFS
jgi:hypothetical protein